MKSFEKDGTTMNAPSWTPLMHRRARVASVVVTTIVASAASAVIVCHSLALVSSMVVVCWMMHALSTCLSIGCPGGNGSWSQKIGSFLSARGGLLGGVGRPACEPFVVPGLFGCRALTKHS